LVLLELCIFSSNYTRFHRKIQTLKLIIQGLKIFKGILTVHRYLKTGQETPATPPVPPVAKSSALPLNSRRTLPLRTSKTLRVTLCQPRPNHVQSLYVKPMSIAKGSDNISSNQKGIHQPADWTKFKKATVMLIMSMFNSSQDKGK
jgi:hypothetical protein